eukprot:3715633-Prymnesium_polylepis.1
MSLPQKAFGDMPEAYFAKTGVQHPMLDRSRAERREFDFAMCEMGRLYAFMKCYVIVDPVIESADDFPGDRHAFGRINDRPYGYKKGRIRKMKTGERTGGRR